MKITNNKPTIKPKASKNKPQTTVLFQVDRILTDPVAYKIYSPVLVPADPLFVEVPVDAVEVSQDGNSKTLTLDGLMIILSTVSNAIEQMHGERLGEK